MWGWQLSYNRRGANSSVGSSLRQGDKKVWLQCVWEIRSNLDKCLNSTKNLDNIITHSWNPLWKELEDNFQVSIRLDGGGGGTRRNNTICSTVVYNSTYIYIFIYFKPIKILSRYVHTHTHIYIRNVATCFSYML
jgi:hypothetical protein